MNFTCWAPVLCSSSPPEEWRTNHLNFSERYALNYICTRVMDSGCIELHHIVSSDSCVFSLWVGENPISRTKYRYMRPTREYPRPDICIELEQRAGSGDDQEDQATVWDCARIFSGIKSALHARPPAPTSRTNAHECSYLARPRAESLSSPSMPSCLSMVGFRSVSRRTLAREAGSRVRRRDGAVRSCYGSPRRLCNPD